MVVCKVHLRSYWWSPPHAVPTEKGADIKIVNEGAGAVSIPHSVQGLGGAVHSHFQQAVVCTWIIEFDVNGDRIPLAFFKVHVCIGAEDVNSLRDIAHFLQLCRLIKSRPWQASVATAGLSENRVEIWDRLTTIFKGETQGSSGR